MGSPEANSYFRGRRRLVSAATAVVCAVGAVTGAAEITGCSSTPSMVSPSVVAQFPTHYSGDITVGPASRENMNDRHHIFTLRDGKAYDLFQSSSLLIFVPVKKLPGLTQDFRTGTSVAVHGSFRTIPEIPALSTTKELVVDSVQNAS